MIKAFHNILELDNSQNEKLHEMCDLWNKVMRKAFAVIAKNNHETFTEYNKKSNANKPNPPKIITSLTSAEIKTLAKKYGLNGRHMNSINLSLSGKLSSLVELITLYLSDFHEQVSAIEKTIKSYQEKNTALLLDAKHSSFSQLVNSAPVNYQKYFKAQLLKYQQFIIDKKHSENNKQQFIYHYDRELFRNLTHIISKNKLNEALIYNHVDKDIFKSTQTYCSNLYQIQRLNKRLNNLKNKISKLDCDMANGKIRICFGGKHLLSQEKHIQRFSQSFQKTKSATNNSYESLLNNKNNNIEENSDNEEFVFLEDEFYEYLKNPQIKFKTVIFWKNAWFDARNHEFLITGAGNETSGNQNCCAYYQENTDSFNIRLCLPPALYENNKNNNPLDKYLTFTNVSFNHNNELLNKSLSYFYQTTKILSEKEKEIIDALKESYYDLIKLKNKNLTKFYKLHTELNNLNKPKNSKKSTTYKQATLETKSIEKLTKEIKKLELLIEEQNEKILQLDKEIKSKSDLVNFDKNDKTIRIWEKRIGSPVSYRFIRNIDKKSPKY